LGQRRKIPINTKEINDQKGEGRKQKKTAEERTREKGKTKKETKKTREIEQERTTNKRELEYRYLAQHLQSCANSLENRKVFCLPPALILIH
jgi:hypothetical protein